MSDNAAIPTMFTKLIVADEEAMARYYSGVYGLKDVVRVDGDSAGTGEKFREVIMSASGEMTGQTLVMFNFTDRKPPRDQQSILGFITDDIEALNGRIVANGGKLIGPLRDQREHGVRVQFSEDPEGALAENVELLPHA
ncbi:VOC family protein [Parafrankia sp. BMG5.11]|uniref:VOC family protein n=1 Tax=Parafrankia sp. BMG5.11 TaxID=222540 RepID=UPI001039F5C8|nr:VOC family protein [Parafrankia sp. BMG5.11]TCJ37057.1 bleomycin resistance protein [Parafrankia sp. BMG5.11]